MMFYATVSVISDLMSYRLMSNFCQLFIWRLNLCSSLHRHLSCWALIESWSFVFVPQCSQWAWLPVPSLVKRLIMHTWHSSYHPASIKSPALLSGFCRALSSQIESLWFSSVAPCLCKSNQTSPPCRISSSSNWPELIFLSGLFFRIHSSRSINFFFSPFP